MTPTGPDPMPTGHAEPSAAPAIRPDAVEVQALEASSTPSLADTLNAVENHLRRFVYFPNLSSSIAVTLWCAHTHAIAAAEQSPILALMSPVRRSGKTRALDVIEPLCARAWRAIRPSEAILFRRIDRDQPTLLLDEVDTIFTARAEFEGIRACLNAGNRAGTTVPRAVAKGRGFELVDFRIYCAKALAGIGLLPETVRDRSIVVPMTRKGPNDVVERLRARDAIRLGRPLGDALAAALSLVTDLTCDDLPPELDDRAQDNWEALLAIAKLAGGAWPERAWAAAVALSRARNDVDDDALGIVLLRDLRTAFADEAQLSTSQLIERLCAIELSPWADLYGKPISGRRIARLLRAFGIEAHRERAGTVYYAAQFLDTWLRYVPPETAATATTATATQGVGSSVAVVALAADSRGRPATDAEVDPDAPITIACRDYRAHQTRHRHADSRWFCELCDDEAATIRLADQDDYPASEWGPDGGDYGQPTEGRTAASLAEPPRGGAA